MDVTNMIQVPSLMRKETQTFTDKAKEFWNGLSVEHIKTTVEDLPKSFYDVFEPSLSGPGMEGWAKSVKPIHVLGRVLTVFVLPIFATIGIFYHGALALANFVFTMISIANTEEKSKIREGATRTIEHVILALYNLGVSLLSPYTMIVHTVAFAFWPSNVIDFHKRLIQGWIPTSNALSYEFQELVKARKEQIANILDQDEVKTQQKEIDAMEKEHPQIISALQAYESQQRWQKSLNEMTDNGQIKIEADQFPKQPEYTKEQQEIVAQFKECSWVHSWASQAALKVFPYNEQELKAQQELQAQQQQQA